ncbi:MAG: hypothetical protein U0X75_25580 [Acidobacteriota bacterium]
MNNGEFLTRLAMWITLCGYAVGAGLFWLARGTRADARARLAWTVGCVALLVHVGFAIHFYHDWQHDSIVRETARQTAEVFGTYWGGGVYFNYALLLGWLADVLWWWRGLDVYRRRPYWVTAFWHGFLLFMFFNATVVFKTGVLRYLGVALCAVLAWLWWRAVSGKADWRKIPNQEIR